MADLDWNSLLPQDWNFPGMSRQSGIATLQSLHNELYQNPAKAQEINAQLQEMFGPQIAKQVIGNALPTIGSQPVYAQNPSDSSLAPSQFTVQDLLSNQEQNAAMNQNPTLLGLQPLNPADPIASASGSDLGGLYRHVGQPITYGDPNSDVGRILAEAELRRKLNTETLDKQKTARSQYLTDLGKLLEEQQGRQLSQDTPEILEDLNSRGLLRSSALGEKLSLRRKELAADTSDALAKQGLAYNEAYTAGLGDVTGDYLNTRNSGLSRYFSINDMNTNIRASKELGFALQPAPQQSSSGKGSAIPVAAIGAFGQLGAAGITANAARSAAPQSGSKSGK